MKTLAWWYLGPENTFHIIDEEGIAWFFVDSKKGKWLRSGTTPSRHLVAFLTKDWGFL